MNNLVLGVIEAFFGEAWSWEARSDYAKFLKDISMNTFIYAPKEDSYLRKKWQQDFPEEHYKNLKNMGEHFNQMVSLEELVFSF